MPRILKVSAVIGLLAGLLIGGFDNIFTVPVLERAIALEEARAESQPQTPAVQEAHETSVSLGAQRFGLLAGNGVRGLIFGLVFAAGFGLLRRAAANWPTVALAATVGLLAFWSLSLFPFSKYPLNPPGVGDEATLLLRQLFQYLMMLSALAGVVGLFAAFHKVNNMTPQAVSRFQIRGLLVSGYVLFMVVIFFAIPGNPDAVPVPIDLLELFRTLTIVGHFLNWALLAAGVTLTLTWYEKKEQGAGAQQPTPASSGASVR